MRRLMTTTFCVCALAAASVSAAQSGQVDKDMKSTAVTGCVAEKDGHFTLDHATMDTSMKEDVKDIRPTSFELTGVDVRAHVGHKVEVTGMMDAKSSKDAGTTATPAMADMHATIDVKSVKMIATSCP